MPVHLHWTQAALRLALAVAAALVIGFNRASTERPPVCA